jgi:hypothetical protein
MRPFLLILPVLLLSTSAFAQHARLGHLHGPAAIQSPDTVAVGETFEVRVVTAYNGCGADAAFAQVDAVQSGWTIRPYNTPPLDPPCRNVAAMPIVHTTLLAADAPGVYTLYAYGRAGGMSGEIEYARTIVAR